MNEKKDSGKVYIIGTGPGDPGLFTLKGKSCLEKADVVIYDYLVSPEILAFIHKESIKIYAGKMSANHHFSQDKINQLLVDYSNKGKVVARLKGGDPFIFGRGGEEALFLKQNKIPFEIVPGVTAGCAVPAYAGIPLTHRSYASDLHFITGHEDPQKEETTINWEALAKSRGTLVFFMGVKNLPIITEMLRQQGKAGTTPVAVIQWGTFIKQKTITGTLDTIVAKAEKAGMKPPAIIVIGEVVQLRPELMWFDKKSLFQKRIIVTRSRSQSSTLVALLKEQGADVIEFPTISIVPVSDFSNLHEVLKQIKSYSWIIFTSTNGVEIFFRQLFQLQRDTRALAHSLIAALGTATATTLNYYGIKADLVPDVFTSEGLIDAFKNKAIDVRNMNILCPGSAIARDYIPNELKNMGAFVRCLTLYENKIPEYQEKEIDEIFTGDIDLVTFTSSSTVKNLIELLQSYNREYYVNRIKGAVIGPVTAETARETGIPVLLMAKEYTIPGLIKAILKYFNSRRIIL